MNWFVRLWNRWTGQNQQPQFSHVFWLLNCSWLCQAVYVVARLDIAEHLRHGPLSIADLAKKTHAQPVLLLQVLRALAGYGIFAQGKDGRFALNAQAKPLLRDADFSIHSYAILWGEQLYPAAGQMLPQVQSGTTAFALEMGAPIWQYYAAHPPEAAVFDAFMSDATDLHIRSLTNAYPFANYARIVDVGAGRGSLLSGVLRAAPQAQGIWFDRAEVLPAAQERLEREGLASRCQWQPGNFLEAVPAGADLYLIKHVLHDWADEPAAKIIANIAQAMTNDSTLVIIEAVMDDQNGVDGLCKLRDLEQMFWTGGRVRTQQDFARLLQPAGLQIARVIRTPIVDACLIEVRKAS